MTVVRFKNRSVNGDFNNLMNNIFAPSASINKTGELMKWPGAAAVNISQSEEAYVIELAAPGYEKEEIAIGLEKDVLTISGEKKQDGEAKEENFIRREFTLSSFKRSFTIDENIDPERISAQFVNGILSLNLPRKQSVKTSKQIAIQ